MCFTKYKNIDFSKIKLSSIKLSDLNMKYLKKILGDEKKIKNLPRPLRRLL